MYPIPNHLKHVFIINKNQSNKHSLEGNIKCFCGSNNIKLNIFACDYKSHLTVKEYKNNFGFRINAECNDCNKKFDIIDMSKHGYNGFICNNGIRVEENDLNKYICHKCKNDIFNIELGIETADKEEFIEDIVSEYDEFEPEDYVDAFDWICISITCTNCNEKIEDWVSFETA